MKATSYAGILPFLIVISLCSSFAGKPATGETKLDQDSGAVFLYITYCGNKYNKITKRQELVIEAIKLPSHLLKIMPRLKETNVYSSKNIRKYHKQLEIVRQNGGDKFSIRVNRKKFSAFYPKGLKRGFIVGADEFSQWNFKEKDIPAPPPLEEKRIYYFDMDWIKYNPLDLHGLVKIT